MANLVTFANSIKDNYTNLTQFNKWIIGIPCAYVFLKTSIGVATPILSNIINAFSSLSKKTSASDPKFDRNKIYLHMFPRKVSKQVPNLSPFSIKVETWLRMHGKQYESVETMDISRSPTGQIPYIYHDGLELADSGLIIEYLEGVMELDSSEGLSEADCGVARAFTKLVEESMSYTYFLHRYCYDYKNFKRVFSLQMNRLYTYLMDRNLSNDILEKMKSRGIGRKAPSQVYKIGQDDIQAISEFLGKKQFMMGERMTKVDCAVFGQLSQIFFVDFHYPHMDFIHEHCPNITPYMERIKARCWPDWEIIVPAGHFN